MTWAHRRQLAYLLSIILVAGIIAGLIYFIKKPAPSCFDGIQNQDEQGVDCGGSCAIACRNLVVPLTVYWARPLLVANGLYDVVALVENQNRDLGIRELSYNIKIYDADNVLLADRNGATFVNPGEKFVIFESRIETSKNYQATKAFISFDRNMVWAKASPVPKIISLERKEFSNTGAPTLRVQVHNNSVKDYRDIKIHTVLSDANENAFAASATFIDLVKGGEKKDAYFTWPTAFPAEPSFVDAYWRINSFELR